MKKIAILGAGISGLALAYFIQKRFGDAVDCTIFEKTSTVGGWLKSVEQNGAIFECGPRSIRSSSKEFDAMLQDLNLTPLFASPDAKKRYIACDGVLQAIPSSLIELFSSKLGRKMLLALTRSFFYSKASCDDETVESYFSRKMGKGASDTFISALTNGIYAARPDELSMRSSFPTIWQKGSLLFAPSRSFSFAEGMQILPKRLAERLSIHLNCPVHTIEEQEDKVIVDSHEFDYLISTIQPSQLNHLLPENDPMRPLLAVPTTSLAAITLAYKASQDIPEGFGFLCTQSEDAHLLGILFDSNVFPEQNGGYQTRLSIMLGGTKNPEMLSYSDDVLAAYAKESVKKYLKIEVLPDFCHITRAENAISRYPVGHYRTLEALSKQKRRITALGSGLTGVSVGDCISHAHEYVYKKLSETLMSG